MYTGVHRTPVSRVWLIFLLTNLVFEGIFDFVGLRVG